MTESDQQREDRFDAALLAAIAAGEEQAFVDLYRRRRGDVYRFAFAMARSSSFAQDVTQEVFLNVLENAARFDPARGSARSWLFGCARHVVLDRLRAERRWTQELPEQVVEHDGDAELLQRQRVARLHVALTRLPLEYRETVVLCELAELSYADAAVVLRCPIGTVRSRLHRGRALLAGALLDEERAAPVANPPLRPSEVCP